MITSSTSGEGKSFLTMNLGSSLAISNKTVLIVELDLRKPKISKELSMPQDKGLTNYLVSEFNKEELIKQVPVHPNLFLLSAGTIPPNPAELLLDARLEELFAWLRSKFDYVIVDTPPLGIVIDSVLIGKHVDASIYVVRQKYTLKTQLKMLSDFKRTEKIPNMSILLNDVKVSRSYGYGYGYGNHSDYYVDSEKKKTKLFGKIKNS
jgi:capsular exopolysaccharide synthesis family protein